MAFLERRGRGLPEGRLGTAYVVAAALSIILLSKNRYAEVGWLDLMKGEVITIDNVDLVMTAATLTLALGILGLFQKEILLVSFDRVMAVTLGKNIVFWDVLLYTLIGLTVSMAVLSVGPLISFGFLLIPALTAHLFAQTMRQFTRPAGGDWSSRPVRVHNSSAWLRHECSTDPTNLGNRPIASSSSPHHTRA
jgi:ABC-type Mn2+/Zn2+ transport system permease subunit